jgi:hypothetical protein
MCVLDAVADCPDVAAALMETFLGPKMVEMVCQELGAVCNKRTGTRIRQTPAMTQPTKLN